MAKNHSFTSYYIYTTKIWDDIVNLYIEDPKLNGKLRFVRGGSSPSQREMIQQNDYILDIMSMIVKDYIFAKSYPMCSLITS